MLNFNQVTIAGALTRDPQIRFLTGDKAVGEFGMAINRKWKDANGETKEDATFVDVTCFGRTAELAGQFLTKGSGCLVSGRLQFEQWEDKNGGGKRSKLKVIADTIQFTDSKGKGERTADDTSGAPAPAPSRPAAAAQDYANEPPF